MSVKHFVFTKSGKLIDLDKCVNVTTNGHVIIYKKNRFTPEVEDKIVIDVDSVIEIADLIVRKIIPGVVFTHPGNRAIGIYPPSLDRYCGQGKVIESIWLRDNPDTMHCWWDSTRGIIK